MAKKNELDGQILPKALEQIQSLWNDCEKKMMQAVDGSDKRRLQVNFAVALDLSEAIPIVETTISFKDKDKEGGMSVVKTFRKSISGEGEDPDQTTLPFAGDMAPRMFDAPDAGKPTKKKSKPAAKKKKGKDAGDDEPAPENSDGE